AARARSCWRARSARRRPSAEARPQARRITARYSASQRSSTGSTRNSRTARSRAARESRPRRATSSRMRAASALIRSMSPGGASGADAREEPDRVQRALHRPEVGGVAESADAAQIAPGEERGKERAVRTGRKALRIDEVRNDLEVARAIEPQALPSAGGQRGG